MQQSDLDQSIYSAAVTCLDVFDLYLKSPGIIEPRRDIAEELRGRFNLWAAYVGAFASPKASLDARLADHSDIRDMIFELLVMVERNITHELRFSDVKSRPDSELAELSDGNPPLLLGLDAVEAALNRLHSLAVAIRRSATRSYRQRVAVNASAANTEGLCYVQFVRRRFPHASDSLVEQVGKSIHIRGQSMYYQQRHNKKIAESRKQTEPDLPAAPETEQVFQSRTVDQPTSLCTHPSPVAPMSETNVSKIDKEELLRRVTTPKPSLSHISRGSSVRESQDEKFGYPKKPSAANTSFGASCPLCSEPIDLSSLTDKKWRDHVDQDIEPYVCISEGCRNFLQFFVTSRDWKDHMQRMHTLDWAWNVHTTLWHCHIDHAQIPEELDQKEFYDKDSFLQHLSKAHGENLSRSQILARARRGRTFRIRDPFTCPFCDCQPDEVVPHVSERPYDLLSAHIASHLKALSFISLSFLDSIENYSESSGSGKQSSWDDEAKESVRPDEFSVGGSIATEYRGADIIFTEGQNPDAYYGLDEYESYEDRQSEWGLVAGIFLQHEDWRPNMGNFYLQHGEFTLKLDHFYRSLYDIYQNPRQDQSPSAHLRTAKGMTRKLGLKIRKAMVYANEDSKKFMPETKLKMLIIKPDVEAILQECKLQLKQAALIQELVDFICTKAYKIFAILITMNKPHLIEVFYEHKLGHEILPVSGKTSEAEDRMYDVESCNKDYYGETVRNIFSSSGWDDETVERFCYPNQWWFMTPRFVKEKFRYKFEKNKRLPFTRYGKERGNETSNYSWVQERSVHVDHIEFRSDQKPPLDDQGNPRVALKTLKQSDKTTAEQEAGVLEMIRGLKSDHLIKAIAYYQQDDKHFFMFPWAEKGNLWEFWNNQENSPSMDKGFLKWAFKQITGLAIAIDELHTQSQSESCRHGDLKPENILCFQVQSEGESKSTPVVRLVITDFGLSKVHSQRTQLRERTQTLVWTKRYAAPEMELNPNGKLSRRFDIWAIGCIFLEFVIWILYGANELEQCTRDLEETFYAIDTITDQTGKQITTAQVHPTVNQWVSYIKRDWRCSTGTALRRLVDLIVNKLLIVKVDDSNGSSPVPVIERHASWEQKSQGQVDSSEQLEYRTYAEGMRGELEDILNGLDNGKIDAIENMPSTDTPTPKGPSHSRSTTKHGQLLL